MANNTANTVDRYVCCRSHHCRGHGDRELDSAVNIGKPITYEEEAVCRDIFSYSLQFAMLGLDL